MARWPLTSPISEGVGCGRRELIVKGTESSALLMERRNSHIASHGSLRLVYGHQTVRCIVAIHQRVFAQAIYSMGVGVITTVTCTVKGAAVWLAEEDIIVE